jgi:predicted double-glycine peptidase
MHAIQPANAGTASRASGSKATKSAPKSPQASPASPHVNVLSAASLDPLETIVQTLNNCGPSSVAAVLAYYQIYRTEAQVAAVLRADNSYWGMSPVDLPAYAQSMGMRALVGYGGSEKLVKLLISNGFPVIVSQYVSSGDPVRHYRPIEAYNDRTQTFVSADPYLGAGHTISYSEFSAIWAESDYRFQVIYRPSQVKLLAAVLRTAGWSAEGTYAAAIRWEEAQINTADFGNVGSWIWYNGRIDIAFDEAELGQYAKARATLVTTSRQGVSSVAIQWVSNEIRRLQQA